MSRLILTVTIPAASIGSTLTDFPFLLNIGDTSGSTSIDTSSIFQYITDNTYIEVQDSLNASLPIEIERWDSGTNEAQLWVKIPTISSTVDTVLRLFHKDTQNSDIGVIGSAIGQSVWTSYYTVYHLNDDTMLDSTVNANDPTASTNLLNEDIIDFGPGKAYSFNQLDSNSYVSFPDLAQGSEGEFTIEVSAATTSESLVTGDGYVYALNLSTSGLDPTTHLRLNETVLDAAHGKIWHIGAHQDIEALTVGVLSYGNYSQTSVENGTSILYINGASEGSDTGTSGYEHNTTSTYLYNRIGQYHYATSNEPFEGPIKEFRVSKDVKTADWELVNHESKSDTLATYLLETYFIPARNELTIEGNLPRIFGVGESYNIVPKANTSIVGSLPIVYYDILITPDAGTITITGNSPIFAIQVREWLIEILTNHAALSNSMTLNNTQTETIEFENKIYVVVIEELIDTFTSEADINSLYTHIRIIQEKIGFNSTLVNNGIFINTIVATLLYQDLISNAIKELLQDTVAFQNIVSNKLQSYVNLIDTLMLQSVNGVNSFTVVISDTYVLDNTLNSTAELKEIITSNLEFFGSVNFDGEEYLFKTYTYNTQSGGITEYVNYNFNSFSYPYAASSSGIYKLDEGITDDETRIDASIKTGIMDFGSSLKKRVPYAYLGITNDERVLLKTISINNGVKKEHWYEAKSYNTALDTTRIQMGKGVKAKYWQFEISNIDGEIFELESFELLPLILKRRIG